MPSQEASGGMLQHPVPLQLTFDPEPKELGPLRKDSDRESISSARFRISWRAFKVANKEFEYTNPIRHNPGSDRIEMQAPLISAPPRVEEDP